MPIKVAMPIDMPLCHYLMNTDPFSLMNMPMGEMEQ